MLVHTSKALGVLHLKDRPEHTGPLLPQAFLPSRRRESSSNVLHAKAQVCPSVLSATVGAPLPTDGPR